MAFAPTDRLRQGVGGGRVTWLEPRPPRAQFGHDLVLRQARQFALALLADESFRRAQVFQQLRDRRVRDRRRLDERAALAGYAPDAAVGLVAVGMAEARLVMADD